MMKKILVLGFILLFVKKVQAQTVNNVPLSDIDVEYIEIIGWPKLFKNELEILIDYGQKTKNGWKEKEKKLLKEELPMVFNSMVGALNFMSKYGYEYENALPIEFENEKSIKYRYLLKRKILNKINE